VGSAIRPLWEEADLLARKSDIDATIFGIRVGDLLSLLNAKSIRTASIRSMAEELEHSPATAADPSVQAKIREQISDLQEKARQLESETREIATEAGQAKDMHDIAVERHNRYFTAFRILAVGLLFATWVDNHRCRGAHTDL
jgi:hypothetical protein